LFWWDDVEAYFLKATSEYFLDHLNFELMSQNHMRKTKFEYHLHRDTELFFSSDPRMVLELNPGGHRILFSSVRTCGHLPSKLALYSLGRTQTISVQYHVFQIDSLAFSIRSYGDRIKRFTNIQKYYSIYFAFIHIT
jgi:hypothetical protein